MRAAARRTWAAFSGVSVSSVTAAVRAMSSRYRAPARPPPTSQAGPVIAGTSTVTASRPASPMPSARLAVIDSTRSAPSARRASRARGSRFP